MWHASIAAAGKVSAIKVTSPYMERNTSWPETVGLGTCMEVDNLMNRDYCAPPCPLPFLLLVVVFFGHRACLLLSQRCCRRPTEVPRHHGHRDRARRHQDRLAAVLEYHGRPDLRLRAVGFHRPQRERRADV